jgi:hypothetical protein
VIILSEYFSFLSVQLIKPRSKNANNSSRYTLHRSTTDVTVEYFGKFAGKESNKNF